MIEMIDLHAHILPELDDGAETLEESVEMCRISYEDGVRTIVATPHILPGVYENNRPTILAKTQELNEAITKCGLRNAEPGIQTPRAHPENSSSNHSELLYGTVSNRSLPSSGFRILPGADVHFTANLLQLCENGGIVTVTTKAAP
jgi:tyrosine-protein phosphatase YwqE